MPPMQFKIATEPEEFEQIHRLNYLTFVEEIPQHPPNSDQRLVDKFHGENTYVICRRGDRVIGMVAVRGQRPFSLDTKLENLDSYLPPGRSLCEFRLLSVVPEHRTGRTLRGLMDHALQHCMEMGYDMAVISGTVQQLKLYKHIGWKPFGPLVGSDKAQYQPMCLTLEGYRDSFAHSLPASPFKRFHARVASQLAKCTQPICLQPGPVDVHPDVRAAFYTAPVSHRADTFADLLDSTKSALCELTEAQHVELFVGTGTLTNDVIAGQLTLLNGRGVILSNGEFGERLVDHATRQQLQFDVIRTDWGQPFDLEGIRSFLGEHPQTGWLWATHCETSTGVLNDLPGLKAVCREADVLICADCTSSMGTVPISLDGVYLASSVSGKGLASFSGLAMVFYNHEIQPEPDRIPRYLDLGYYATHNGVPFTSSSNLLKALHVALERFQGRDRYQHIARLSSWLRQELRDRGFKIVAPDICASPAVVSVELPAHISSVQTGHRLEENGYLLSYKSEYLIERNWIQVCILGECTQAAVDPILDLLAEPHKPIRERSSA